MGSLVQNIMILITTIKNKSKKINVRDCFIFHLVSDIKLSSPLSMFKYRVGKDIERCSYKVRKPTTTYLCSVCLLFVT